MPCECCVTAGLAEAFGERRSKKDAKRFRRKGLETRAERLLEAIIGAGKVAGIPKLSNSLEIGAGIGGFSLSLLERGVDRAVAVDASPAAARTARELAEERGFSDRFSIQQADFATLHIQERYDAVILERVVCCYPDWHGLLAPAAAAAGHVLALTYPRDAWYNKVFVATVNGVHALLRKEYRAYVHPPAAMHELLREAGLEPRIIGRDGPWDMAVARREG